MSIEDARKAIEAMSKDENLNQEVLSAKDQHERMTILRQAGYNCRVEDFQEIMRSLSDDELENVAGGVKPQNCAYM